MESQESHDVSFKELPTREQKLRRNKDRRDSPTLTHIRPRLKSNTSPVHDTDMDKSFSDRSVSSSPDSISLHLSPNSAFSCYNKYVNRGESVASPPVITEATSTNCDSSNHSNDNETDFDQPLDMTTKRSQQNGTAQFQQQRPSVITCASALLRTQCSVAPRVCSIAVAEPSSAPSDESGQSFTCTSDNSNDSMKYEDLRTGHRREIATGSCDPVIDEHFRRSLGKDYQQIFSKSSANSVSITVDDHFAKALGDTWLQLQQSEAVVPDSSEQSQQQNLHSKQQSHFLKHSPEIVSS